MRKIGSNFLLGGQKIKSKFNKSARNPRSFKAGDEFSVGGSAETARAAGVRQCGFWGYCKLAPFFGHRSKLLCATSRGNAISSAFPLEKVGRSYPRDAARSATQRGRPCLPLGSGSAGLRHYAPSHLLPRRPALINTPFARPAGYKQALPGHTVRRRRPYNAENYFPRP